MIYGYVRVSTSEQAEGGQSLETQNRQICGYAAMKLMQTPWIYVEGGVSGSVPLTERPEGAKLMASIKSGDHVIVAKLDRMFRSAADALDTLETFKEVGVGLHMIDLGGDVTGNGISKLVFTILSAVAENERDRIRERIKDVKADQRSRGKYLGGDVPFGYDLVGDDLVPNVTHQLVIHRMIDMKGKSVSFRGIADDIFGQFGLHFQPMTVKRILDREMATVG